MATGIDEEAGVGQADVVEGVWYTLVQEGIGHAEVPGLRAREARDEPRQRISHVALPKESVLVAVPELHVGGAVDLNVPGRVITAGVGVVCVESHLRAVRGRGGGWATPGSAYAWRARA